MTFHVISLAFGFKIRIFPGCMAERTTISVKHLIVRNTIVNFDRQTGTIKVVKDFL